MNESLEVFCTKSIFQHKNQQDTTASAMGEIIWAVDPAHVDEAQLNPIAQVLNLWSQSFGCPVDPVAVVGSGDAHLPPSIGSSVVPIEPEDGGVELKGALRNVKIDKLKELTFLVNKRTVSLDNAVSSALRLAQRKNAWMMAVSTHGRTGWQHLRLGSFAERLIAQSSIPVLSINPQTQAPEVIRKILVPTDFSKSSQRLLANALEWAKRLSAEVVILNRFMNPLSGLAYCGAAEVPVDAEFLNSLIEDAEKERRTKGNAWLALAKSMDVACDVRYESDTDYLSTLILNTADKEHTDLIVMGANRKLLGRGIGRTSRKILTASTCPVILCPLQNEGF